MKTLVRSFLTIVTLMLVSFGSICFASEQKKIEVIGAVYEVTENVLDQDLGYGIHHIKDKAQSSKNDSGLFPQSVNILEIPARDDVRVVNWTMSNPSGWSKATVRSMANDFESKNPGWVVVAAVNGDFFDINGTNKALPYQTGGVTVSDGEVYRPFTNSQTIGIRNSRADGALVAEEKFEVSAHMLNIYDANDNVIYTKEVKHFNETPADGEVAIWFSYKDETGVAQRMTLPSDNSYFVKAPERALAMTPSNVYAKGIISATNEEIYMHYGQFGIQTTNEEIKAKLSLGVKVRVQQHVIGDYAECDNITGGGVCLIRNGEAVDNTSNMDTHPRTCIGAKEDGTLVFMTVDGRQDNKNMHGMAYNELSATLLYYGCNEAYNLDGGGSTTMLIRNSYGDFDVLNSPSDGTERHDSNSLLIVVPELSFNIKNVADTNVTIDYVAPAKDVTISNIKITINGETKEVDEFPYVWEGLNPSTSYKIEAKYDLEYKSSKETKEIIPISIKTGVAKPYVEKAYFFVYEDKVIINYKIANPANITCINSVLSGMFFDSLSSLEGRIIASKADIDLSKIVISLGYNLKSSVSEYTEEEIEIKEVKFDFSTYKLSSDYLVETKIFDNNLPTLEQTNEVFNGWKQNEEVITTFDELDLSSTTVLEPMYTPLGGKTKGCAKKSSELTISLLGLSALVVLVLRRKHQ